MEKNEKKLTNFDSEEWRVGPKAFIFRDNDRL